MAVKLYVKRQRKTAMTLKVLHVHVRMGYHISLNKDKHC